MSEVDEFEGYEEITRVGEWSYDWTEMRFYRDDSGRIFYLSASGCSCNDWSDQRNEVSDMVEVPTLNAARAAYESVIGIDPTYGHGSVTDWLELRQTLATAGLR